MLNSLFANMECATILFVMNLLIRRLKDKGSATNSGTGLAEDLPVEKGNKT